MNCSYLVLGVRNISCKSSSPWGTYSAVFLHRRIITLKREIQNNEVCVFIKVSDKKLYLVHLNKVIELLVALLSAE